MSEPVGEARDDNIPRSSTKKCYDGYKANSELPQRCISKGRQATTRCHRKLWVWGGLSNVWAAGSEVSPQFQESLTRSHFKVSILLEQRRGEMAK